MLSRNRKSEIMEAVEIAINECMVRGYICENTSRQEIDELASEIIEFADPQNQFNSEEYAFAEAHLVKQF